MWQRSHSLPWISSRSIFLRSPAGPRVHTQAAAEESLKFFLNRVDGVVRSPFADVEIPHASLSYPQFVFRDFDRFRQRIALESSDGRAKLTFGQLRRLSRDFSVALSTLGVAKGHAVGFYLRNSPEFGLCFYGTLMSGATVAPCNPMSTSSELATQLRMVSTRVLVTSPESLETALDAVCQCPSVTDIIVAQLGAAVPSGSSVGDVRVMSLDEALMIGCQHEATEIRIDAAGQSAVFPFSSGTTGLPKAIALSHRNLIANLCQATGGDGQLFDHCAIDEDGRAECTVAVMPFFHIYGMIIELGGALMHGAKIVTMSQFKPEEFLDAVERHRATQLHFVPPLSLFIAQSDLVPHYDLSSVR